MANDIFARCSRYDDPERVQKLGVYPYFRPIEASAGASVTTHGRARVMIGSNNYLGLTHHPRTIAAAQAAIAEFGTGCTGSRLLNGNLLMHEQLEARLAAFVGKEAAIVYSTGFGANQGALSCLVGRHDVIYCDRENHASIIEGTQVSFGKTLKFRHNDMNDLERLLRETRHQHQGAVIVADGVFSMSGEIFDVPAAAALARAYECRLFIDDAHALGVLGHQGRGTESMFGLDNAVDILSGTFSKSFASIGGFVAGPRAMIQYLRHKSRSFMFTVGLPPAATATVLAALDIVQSEPEHLKALWENTRFMHAGIQGLGFDTLRSATPIIPLVIGDDLAAMVHTQALYERGIFATPVLAPAVPANGALIRTSYMASHTRKQLTYVLDVLNEFTQTRALAS